uniref:Ig-like domain-containing protein n=1 Tax=Anabas testudineus TaxID=64144 RepID=A0AAQ6IRW5_ANATE
MLLCEQDQKVYAASLRINPNRAQFFEYESLTFHCDDVSYCEVVNASNVKIPSCNKTNKRTSTGSSCTIRNVYADDSGKYWFVAGGGKISSSVNITVTEGSVILEIPALPVMEGEAVTLTCRNKTTSSQTSADFYKDGVLINSSSTGKMIINSVSTSDEGLYKCSISGAGESAESRLIVRAGSVILEIPALPVMEGEAVTLTCRNKMTSSQTSANFYKDGVSISNSSTGNSIVRSVSKCDEGLYKCSISGAGESAESRLTVRSRDGHKETKNNPSSSTPWIISTVLLAVLLVVVGLCHFVKGSWNR